MSRFETMYMDKALFDLGSVIVRAEQDLRGIDFDTIVGTGFSGGVVVPALALAMDKKFVLVRKDNDDSHHGGGRLLGDLGERWIFVDDFVATGRTQERVIGKIQNAQSWDLMSFTPTPVRSTFVGTYLYDKRPEPTFTPARCYGWEARS